MNLEKLSKIAKPCAENWHRLILKDSHLEKFGGKKNQPKVSYTEALGSRFSDFWINFCGK